MWNTKPAPTTGRLGQNLFKSEGHPLEVATAYRSLVGALHYLTLTRPDVSFSVNKACQCMANPTTAHWTALKRLLRYLHGTFTYGLHIQPSASLNIHAYADTDQASCPDDRRSAGGYGIFLGPNLVSWSSAKQHVVFRSSTEAKYRLLHLLPLKSPGSRPQFRNFASPLLPSPSSGRILKVQLISQPILFCILAPNILNLTSILFVITYCTTSSKSSMFLPRIKLQMFYKTYPPSNNSLTSVPTSMSCLDP